MGATVSRKMTRRIRQAVIAVTVLGFALGAAPAARAGDFCFNAGVYSFVGKGFKVPGKGRCKPFTGWKEYIFGGASVVSGTACTPLIGDFMDLSLTSQQSIGSGAMLESIHVPLKANVSGAYNYQYVNGASGSSTTVGVGNVCTAPYQP